MRGNYGVSVSVSVSVLVALLGLEFLATGGCSTLVGLLGHGFGAWGFRLMANCMRRQLDLDSRPISRPPNPDEKKPPTTPAGVVKGPFSKT